MKALILSLTLILVACGKPNQESSAAIDTKMAVFPNSYKVYSADSSCTDSKRIYITHGFGGNKSVYDEAPFVTFFNNLRASCFQIISYDLPYGDFTVHFSDGGYTYSQNFQEYILNLKAEIETTYGQAQINIAGGVSFGGFHSIMAIELTNAFDGFFALKPVTDYTALEELSQLSSAGFNAFNNVAKLSQTKGLIIYGLQDYRIDYTKTIELENQLNQQPNNQVSFTALVEGHASNDGNLQMIVNYLNANF